MHLHIYIILSIYIYICMDLDYGVDMSQMWVMTCTFSIPQIKNMQHPTVWDWFPTVSPFLLAPYTRLSTPQQLSIGLLFNQLFPLRCHATAATQKNKPTMEGKKEVKILSPKWEKAIKSISFQSTTWPSLCKVQRSLPGDFDGILGLYN